ncbi:unnamed protein product, partial [Allacma fusca]
GRCSHHNLSPDAQRPGGAHTTPQGGRTTPDSPIRPGGTNGQGPGDVGTKPTTSHTASSATADAATVSG